MRYYVETHGCTMNFGESRKLSEDMASLGHQQVGTPEEADIAILNTCTVVDTTEKKMLDRISQFKRMGLEVVVTGCMAKVQPRRIEIRLPGSPIIPPEDYGGFREEMARRFGTAGEPTVPEATPDHIIPVAQGCRGNCSYCITKFARGDLLSYPADGLIEDFNRGISNGSKEILLTAQDTACYGLDGGIDLPELIRRMLRTEGDYRIRVGMMNPNHLHPIAEGMLECMNDDRLYRFLHIPVQSGSNTILRGMRRGYTRESFMELVDMLRSHHPDISIATDIITSFPGETDEDHLATMDLVRELKADTLNITRFSARPGTDAASMEPVHGRIAKARSAELTALKNEVEYNVNQRMVGRCYDALATEHKDGTIVRTGNYRPVVIDGDIPLGTFVKVRVTECRPTYLFGELLESF
ncbi:MAG: tRNA (N(6)-L-threonylcarbamoyladenosine(37)-C(2))-methylthiotransferase [Candidatus Methanomethylophilaceae archaeon]|nr:tRNA (N(6)-L-threonylcarbamoyladenosine(37)-C(2))-methylthiotransferase [Candidatus Methanomethylophilaceae archaeon]